MNVKLFLGATGAALLMGMGVLVGGVVGTGGVSAQTPSASPTQAPTTNPAQPGNTPSGKQGGPGWGMHGGRGPGDMGMGGRGMRGGGFGWGMGGRTVTADTANNVISNTISSINLVKSDLAYANGKMDVTDAQRWITGADSLVKTAQSSVSSSNYAQAVEYARAAEQLAMTADTAMAQKLGADKLPSYSQRPQHGNRPGNANGNNSANATAPTQAQASRVLVSTYNNLVAQSALAKSSANSASAGTYLTDAENAYKAAYASYQAGYYQDAVNSARIADQLAGVVDTLLKAPNTPSDPNTPLTVPAPTF